MTQRSNTKRSVTVKNGSGNLSVAFNAVRQWIPCANTDDIAAALFVDMDRDKSPYCYHLFYSYSGSFEQLTLLNVSNEPYTLDLGIAPMEMPPGDMLTITGMSKMCFEAVLRKEGIAMPWLKGDVKTEKCCYRCQVRNSQFVELRLCGGCELVRYCSRRCQKISWKHQHRYECTFI